MVAACCGSVIHDGRDACHISAVALVSTVELDMAAVSHRSLQRTHRWAGSAPWLRSGCSRLRTRAFHQPDSGTSAPEVVEFYGELSTRIVVGRLLSLISIAVFVVAARGLRSV
jgi:hypothetical protein